MHARFQLWRLLENKFLNGYGQSWPRAGRLLGAALALVFRAKLEAAGGVDLIILYNSGRYRMAGRGSLSGLMPYATRKPL